MFLSSKASELKFGEILALLFHKILPHTKAGDNLDLKWIHVKQYLFDSCHEVGYKNTSVSNCHLICLSYNVFSIVCLSLQGFILLHFLLNKQQKNNKAVVCASNVHTIGDNVGKRIFSPADK